MKPIDISVESVDGAPRYVVLTFTAPNGDTGSLRVESHVAQLMTNTIPARAIMAWCERIKVGERRVEERRITNATAGLVERPIIKRTEIERRVNQHG